jgi:type IV secretion system protein VirB8
VSNTEQHFDNSRSLAEPLMSGEAAEKAALSKEAQRLVNESLSFEKSKESWMKRLMKASLIVTGVSVALNFLLGGAIAVMMPLKEVVPYLLEVDRQTGDVNIREPLSKPTTTYGVLVDEYFASLYVTSRESYDWDLAQRDYDTVKAFSVVNGSTFREWDTFIKSQKSPLVVLNDKAKVVINITSRNTDVQTSTSVIRFTKTIIGQDGKPSALIPPTNWIATLKYEYPNPKLKPAQRRLNPLGMQITSYRQVEEKVGG